MPRNELAAALACFMLWPESIHAQTTVAHSSDVVEATIDYSSQQDENDAADEFFGELRASTGSIIFLKLTLLPPKVPLEGESGGQQEDLDPGYVLERITAPARTGVAPAAGAVSGQGETSTREEPGSEQTASGITCGVNDGEFGILDNYLDDYTLSFGHPRTNHESVQIYIGTKSRHPFQSLVCSIEDYTQYRRTPLIATGYFHVLHGQIPTLNQYLLVPADPSLKAARY